MKKPENLAASASGIVGYYAMLNSMQVNSRKLAIHLCVRVGVGMMSIQKTCLGGKHIAVVCRGSSADLRELRRPAKSENREW